VYRIEDILKAPVRFVDQGLVIRLTVIQSLLQRVQYEVCPHGTTDLRAHNVPSEHVNDEGHIIPVLTSREIGEIRDPELIGMIRVELQIDPRQVGLVWLCR
jgi:hypothetical protein